MKKQIFIDLHMHSYYSDGKFSPKEIMGKAKKANFKVMSLTDHDTIKGVPEAIFYGKKFGIKIIPGIEFYTSFENKNLHILGYGIDINNRELIDALKNIQKKHLQKVEKSVTNLKKIGFKIEFAEVLKTKSEYIGLDHIVSLLWKTPSNVQKIKEDLKTPYLTLPVIAAQYFIPKKPAYLPLETIPAETAISIIKKSGGVPVLGHPGQQLSWRDDNLIGKLKQNGLMGMEVFSPYHNWHQVEHYQKLAAYSNLLMTGGSDFHGDLPLEKGEIVKNQWDYFKVPYQVYLNLKKYL